MSHLNFFEDQYECSGRAVELVLSDHGIHDVTKTSERFSHCPECYPMYPIATCKEGFI